VIGVEGIFLMEKEEKSTRDHAQEKGKDVWIFHDLSWAPMVMV